MTMIQTRLHWDGDKLDRRAHSGAAQGLRNAAEHILQVSREQVPIEEGTLERSGRASMDRSSLTAAVSYDTVYAARQHEELTWQHAPGRKAKYLEDPFLTEEPQVAALIQAAIRRALIAGIAG
jgi:hypothetical protein